MKDALHKSLIALISTGLSISVVLPAFAQDFSITQSINPKATYLRTSSQDVGALDAVVINLINLGILPGSTIRLEQLGSFRAIGNPGPELSTAMGGIFSSSNTLLSRNFLNRVPGAIDAGIDSFTGLTNLEALSTDIPEDFRITDTQIQVPVGAAFLFVGALDSQFLDNTDLNNDFAVQISTVAPPAPTPKPNPIPEPNITGGLLVLSLGWVLNKRITKKFST